MPNYKEYQTIYLQKIILKIIRGEICNIFFQRGKIMKLD